MRRWRQRGPVRRPGAWTPAGVVDSAELAEAMAALLREEGAGTEARVISGHDLFHKLREEDRERILDLLNSRTTADIKRDLELRWAAGARLASRPERRLGGDRRSGRDRRFRHDPTPVGHERRSGRDRRAGRDRRRAQTAA